MKPRRWAHLEVDHQDQDLGRRKIIERERGEGVRPWEKSVAKCVVGHRLPFTIPERLLHSGRRDSKSKSKPRSAFWISLWMTLKRWTG
ncbi:hypothetical protein TNIN_257461 [Trichonephila inaurata madagascariensis]|uniref:Uncharacterized protein n=1 Tax=Trichonephila inaurata madagascariensis TaxID=2747483 RepID=A0A8X6ITV7_9ARAC|nr:hypothetical protein TNIN_257461 [Trichonephila inaurata madagascariensis]